MILMSYLVPKRHLSTWNCISGLPVDAENVAAHILAAEFAKEVRCSVYMFGYVAGLIFDIDMRLKWNIDFQASRGWRALATEFAYEVCQSVYMFGYGVGADILM